MKTRLIIILFLAGILPIRLLSAAKDSTSKWSYSFSVNPHFTNTYWSVFYPKTGLGVEVDPRAYTFKPAAQFSVAYNPLKNTFLKVGVGYNIYNTPIIKQDPYNMYDIDPGFSMGMYAENATIHMLDLTGAVDYCFLDKKHYRLYISMGDVSSFAIAKTSLPDIARKIQTTIYQNYVQLSLGMDIKTKHKWDWYLAPVYRIAMVNYHDTVHYNIWAYPNVFYERMLGLEVGMKFNKFKKRG